MKGQIVGLLFDPGNNALVGAAPQGLGCRSAVLSYSRRQNYLKLI